MAGLWGLRGDHENRPCQCKKCNNTKMSTEPLQYDMWFLLNRTRPLARSEHERAIPIHSSWELSGRIALGTVGLTAEQSK